MSNATPDDDSAPAEPAGATVVPDWDALFTEVYTRLKAMASRQIGRQSAATLQTTALVHEAYLRMRKAGGLQFAEREQFFAYAARAMRHLLLDRARDRLRATGGAVAVTLDADDARLSVDGAEEAIALDGALSALAQASPRAARVVELRYFAGLSLEQTAEVLGVARTTVDRDWRFARAYLNAGFESRAP
jgi:RNA polymerase sigma factor (TIGR02999 family)